MASQKWRKGIFFHANIHEHGLETLFDVLDAAFKNAAHEVHFALAFDIILFQLTVLEQRDAALEGFGVDDDGIALAGVNFPEAKGSFDLFQHVCLRNSLCGCESYSPASSD